MLPNKISATNIELLIRNPYGFYAKNILKLRKLDNIFDNKSLSKFGNFIHKIIEKYSLEFNENINNKYQQILEIGYIIAQEDYLNDTAVNIWWPKFSAIAKEFVEFDLERRNEGVVVIPEIYGEMLLDFGDKEILITAIADRLEQKKSGIIHIMDYKTGSLPSKTDLIQGISVQLLIEAMIAEIGGFPGIKGDVEELVYVKIASRPPYISSISINATELNIKEHKRGLIKILSHYISTEEFKVNNNSKFAPKYDDYEHLERKE